MIISENKEVAVALDAESYASLTRAGVKDFRIDATSEDNRYNVHIYVNLKDLKKSIAEVHIKIP